MTKELPAHIAAALRSAGGAADTGGNAWSGRDLTEGSYHQFPHDDGATPAGLSRALEALKAGAGDEAAVVAVLADVRVFVPIVAAVATSEITAEGLVQDKEADMALVTIAAPDGRRALPVFSSVEALHEWHSQARPVAVFAPRAALSAVSEQAELMVLDPGAEVTFVVRRPALWALAQQHPWLPSYADPAVLEPVRDAVRAWFGQVAPGALSDVVVRPGTGVAARTGSGALIGGGGAGPELAIGLALRPGLSAEDVDTLLAALNAHLAAMPVLAERVDSLQIALTASA